MATHLYDFGPGATPSRIEVHLEGTRLTQRRLGADEEWDETASSFTNHLEAREAFEQLAFVYGRKGRLIAQASDGGPAQLRVDGGKGSAEVVADWLLEEGPRLLGEELFDLYRTGGLPLGFEGRALVEATVANVSTPTNERFSSRYVHHPHFLMDELLARPIAATVEFVRRFVPRLRAFEHLSLELEGDVEGLEEDLPALAERA